MKRTVRSEDSWEAQRRGRRDTETATHKCYAGPSSLKCPVLGCFLVIGEEARYAVHRMASPAMMDTTNSVWSGSWAEVSLRALCADAAHAS